MQSLALDRSHSVYVNVKEIFQVKEGMAAAGSNSGSRKLKRAAGPRRDGGLARVVDHTPKSP